MMREPWTTSRHARSTPEVCPSGKRMHTDRNGAIRQLTSLRELRGRSHRKRNEQIGTWAAPLPVPVVSTLAHRAPEVVVITRREVVAGQPVVLYVTDKLHLDRGSGWGCP